MGTFRPDVALTFDDVLLVPRHSTVHPRNVSVASRFTRAIPLNIPFVSAAMDTVTEADMAMAMARLGSIGVIHKNMPIDRQAAEVDRVKRSESGMIMNPITLGPDRPLREAQQLMVRFKISGVPIVDGAGKLVGIIKECIRGAAGDSRGDVDEGALGRAAPEPDGSGFAAALRNSRRDSRRVCGECEVRGGNHPRRF